jgi:pimeloyl-ACP methyl ester carboxylesterase
MSGQLGFEPLFAPLADRGFRAIAPDQLSMGLTDTRPHAWPTNGLRSLVDHVSDFVDVLGLDEFSLVGHSQGSYVAAKYAAVHPGRIRHILFLSSGTIGAAMGVPNPENRGVNAVRAYDGTLEGLHRMLTSTLGESGSGGRDLDRMAKLLFANADRPGVPEARAAFEAARDRMQADPDELAWFSLRGELPALVTPARFMWGKQDLIAPFEMGRQLAMLLPQIPFEFLDGCGHHIMYDQTKHVLDTLFDLLDEPIAS